MIESHALGCTSVCLCVKINLSRNVQGQFLVSNFCTYYTYIYQDSWCFLLWHWRGSHTFSQQNSNTNNKTSFIVNIFYFACESTIIFLNDVDWNDWNKTIISRKFNNAELLFLFLKTDFASFCCYALFKSAGNSTLHIAEQKLRKHQLAALKIKPKIYLAGFMYVDK